MDDEILAEESYEPAVFFGEGVRPFVQDLQITPGGHHIRLAFVDELAATTHVLYEATPNLAPGDILRILYNPLSDTPCKGRDCLQ